MNTAASPRREWLPVVFAWAVHALTASGAVLAFLAFVAVEQTHFRLALLWLGAALVVVEGVVRDHVELGTRRKDERAVQLRHVVQLAVGKDRRAVEGAGRGLQAFLIDGLAGRGFQAGNRATAGAGELEVAVVIDRRWYHRCAKPWDRMAPEHFARVCGNADHLVGCVLDVLPHAQYIGNDDGRISRFVR